MSTKKDQSLSKLLEGVTKENRHHECDCDGNCGDNCKCKSDPVNPSHDSVNHPKHYTSHPSGVECIQITEHMNFNLGNSLKYIWRASIKHDSPVEDLKKAKWYLTRELDRLS